MLKEVYLILSFIAINLPALCQAKHDSLYIQVLEKHATFYEICNLDSTSNSDKELELKKSKIKDFKIFCNSVDKITLVPFDENQEEDVPWIGFLKSLLSNRSVVGTFTCEGYRRQEISPYDIWHCLGNDKYNNYKPGDTIQKGDTLSLFYKEKSKIDSIYKETKFTLENDALCIQDIELRTKDELDAILRDPKIEITSPDEKCPMFYRSADMDTIRWKTTLQATLTIKAYTRDNGTKGKTKKWRLAYDTTHLTNEKDSIYFHPWSPRYDAFLTEKAWQDRKGYYYKGDVKIVISGNYKDKVLRDSVTVTVKPFISFTRIKKNFNFVLLHVWRIENNVPNTQQDSLILNIRRYEKEKLDATVYTIRTAANSQTNETSMKKLMEKYEEKNDKKLKYEFPHITDAIFKQDSSLRVLSRPYQLLDKECDEKTTCRNEVVKKERSEGEVQTNCFVKKKICTLYKNQVKITNYTLKSYRNKIDSLALIKKNDDVSRSYKKKIGSLTLIECNDSINKFRFKIL